MQKAPPTQSIHSDIFNAYNWINKNLSEVAEMYKIYESMVFD